MKLSNFFRWGRRAVQAAQPAPPTAVAEVTPTRPATGRRRPKASEVELPSDLMCAIEAMHVLRWSPGEDGEPRLVIQIDGMGGWLYSLEANRDMLLRRWPSLTDPQLARALRFMDSMLYRHLAATFEAFRPRRNWATSWKYD